MGDKGNMNTESIYELQGRLRAACIAGTNLLSEDFRLRRAFEAFKPLKTASPVFAKVGELTEKLLSPDCQNQQGTLLDTITLVDAVICTLGTVDVKGEVETAGIINAEENTGSLIINAPYSTLKGLLEALTTSGGGHYGYVCDIHENNPELFQDYRVKYALVQALGASYAELADKVEQWIKEDNDKTILPFLYKDFDPKGKKEMVRRVKVIRTLAGAEANDFYVKMLEEAQKDVRLELIDALRHEPKNMSLLLDMSKTERGKNKDKVFELLAEIKNVEVHEYFKELAKKKPETVLKYLKNTTVDWSSELVADICNMVIEKIDMIDSASDEEKIKISDTLQSVVRTIFGKGGADICECYRRLLAKKEKINQLLKKTWKKPKYDYEYDVFKRGVLNPSRYTYDTKELDIETALGKVLHHSLIANPDLDLQALAVELYQNKNTKETNIKFLPAVISVKFSNDEDCSNCLEEQVTEKILLVPKQERKKAVIEAAAYVKWDERACGYEFWGTNADIYYPDCRVVRRPMKLSSAAKIMEWLKKHASERVDDILAQWVVLDDKDMCQEMGEYFYKKALVITDNRNYMECMKTCGWTVCKGLGVKHVKKHPDILSWALHSWLTILPGSKEAIMEEMRTICDMVKSGQLKANRLKIEDLEKNMTDWSGK